MASKIRNFQKSNSQDSKARFSQLPRPCTKGPEIFTFDGYQGYVDDWKIRNSSPGTPPAPLRSLDFDPRPRVLPRRESQESQESWESQDSQESWALPGLTRSETWPLKKELSAVSRFMRDRGRSNTA